MPDLRLVNDENLPERESPPAWTKGTEPRAKESEQSTLGPLAWIAIFAIGLIGGFAGFHIAFAILVAVLIVAVIVGIIRAVKSIRK